MALLLDSIICYNSSQNSGKYSYLPIYCIINGMIKDSDQQPYEEVHKARSTRIPSSEVFVSMELGCTTLLTCRCVHQLSKLHTLDFFLEASL